MQQYFEKARENMVEGQLRPNKVTDESLLAAMRHVPREKFLPADIHALAYVDDNIALGHGRYMPEPMILARLVQAAAVQKTDTVLDIACGTGYSSAILGGVAKSVIGIEQDKNMVMEGVQLLDRLDIKNALLVHQGDLRQGYAKQAPYNVILINGAVPAVPEKIKSQLAEGGRLVTVIFRNGHGGSAVLITRQGDSFSTHPLFDASTPIISGFEQTKGFIFQ
jgi:protein-L-isoaspartate(D-aspartate) O-methyltransferase